METSNLFNFLRRAKLEQYHEAIEKQDISLEFLITLSEKELNELADKTEMTLGHKFRLNRLLEEKRLELGQVLLSSETNDQGAQIRSTQASSQLRTNQNNDHQTIINDQNSSSISLTNKESLHFDDQMGGKVAIGKTLHFWIKLIFFI